MKMLEKVTQMGWDGHRKFSRVSGRDAQGEVVWRERVEHQDRVALREQLRRWPKGIPVVLEGTFGWGWTADEIQAAGLVPRLANSRKVAEWRKARGMAKNNRLDGDLLSELPSHQPPWWEVWLAPPAVRQQREWMRFRMSWVRMQSSLKHRMHAVLHRHGIYHEFSDLFGGQGRRFLTLLITEKEADRLARGEPPLPDSARATRKGYLQVLDHLRRQMARVTSELRHQICKTPAACRLKTLPGIAWILAYTILAEIGPIARFKSFRHLASYSLLAPLADDSGDEDHDQAPRGRHVGKFGRRTLKWAWIEAAHSAVKHPRFKEIYDRRTNGGKRDRNRGTIAVAHELCRIAYALLTKEVDFTDTPPPRPGSAAERASRSGTGQPDPARVAAAT